MRTNKHTLGIVGFGGMGDWHRRLVEKGIDGLSLAGVYDIDPERQRYAQELGYRAYESLDALLEDPQIDIVLIATPNDLHRDLAICAMQAGKNVVSEKPVTLTSEDLQQMIDTARKTNRFFTVHQNRRWDEDFLTVKKLLAEGVLGDVFRIESRIHGSRGIPGDWRKEAIHGGGMLYDWGIHIIDQMLQLVPRKITSVYCTETHVANREVDDGFFLTLGFEGGLTAQLEVGTCNYTELPRWYVLGTDGSAVVDEWRSGVHGKIVHITRRDKNDAKPVATAAGLTKTMAPRTEETICTRPLPDVHSDVRDFYRNVMDVIDGIAEPVIRHDEMQRVLRVVETAFRSAKENRVLPFE